MQVKCIETIKNHWLKAGMILTVTRCDAYGRLYFTNGGVVHKRLFELFGTPTDFKLFCQFFS